MVWLVRTLVVCAIALDGPIFLASNHQPPVENFFVGLLGGLLIVWLSSLIGNRCKKFRAAHPLGAKRVGIAFYLIGTAIAALCIGLATFAAYAGFGRVLVVVPASVSIVYWAAGWGLYRSLVHRADPRPAVQESSEAVDKLAPRSDWAALVAKAPTGKRRLRKIALSLAIVGALAAPFGFRTYEARPMYKAPSTAQEKKEFADTQDYCRENDRKNESALKRKNEMALLGIQENSRDVVGMGDVICSIRMGEFDPSGDYKYHFDRLEYLALNIGAAIAAFIVVFGLVFLIPMLVGGFAFLIRRYWKWLNA
jgi:hypothetical protein